MISGLLALVLAAVFSGAAIYVLIVEHPARAALDDRAALMEWKPAYRRGAATQGTIALVATLLGALAWWQSREHAFALGALLSLLPWPWTLLVIRPTNDRLLAASPDDAGPETRKLLARWARLHAVRVVLGCLAVVAFVLALVAPDTI